MLVLGRNNNEQVDIVCRETGNTITVQLMLDIKPGRYQFPHRTGIGIIAPEGYDIIRPDAHKRRDR